MQFDSYCMECLTHRECRRARELLTPEQAKAYLGEIMDAMAHAPKDVAGPYLVPVFRDILEKYGIRGDTFAKEKKDSNDFVLALLDETQKVIDESEDPLLTALKYAQVGNFLDFGVLSPETIEEKLLPAIRTAKDAPLDETEYRNFREDLQSARRLLILGDNAGEIAFDTLLVRQLQKDYPALQITYCVRGGNALNDATREDAAYVGMDKLVPVIDNGTRISGTELSLIGEELRTALKESDVILAKGQANFETMAGCRLNVYYNFLCKCERLAKIVRAPLFSGQFLSDLRMKNITPFPA